MSFNWDDFLVQAVELIKKQDEAGYRSAISRAYYSAFHKAFWIAFMHCGFSPKNNGDDHAKVCDILSRNSDLMQLGKKLGKLKTNRWKADYKDDQSINEPLAKSCLDWAEEIKKGLIEYSRNRK